MSAWYRRSKLNALINTGIATEGFGDTGAQSRATGIGKEERLQRAAEEARAPMMVFDDEGRIVLLSQAWLDAAGYAAEELRTIKDWTARAHNGSGESVLRHLQRAADTGCAAQSADFVVETRSGEQRDWSLIASALGTLPDGRRLFICIASDSTERKRAAAAARENDERFRDLLEALPAAIYTTDVEGHITFFNHAAVELWGCRPQLGTSQWCGSWRLYWPDGRAMRHDQCPMAMALKESRPIRGYEAIAERPDGTRVSFLPYPTPLYDSQGRLAGAVNMLVDITARKQAETRLTLLAREVDHRAKNMLAVIQGVLHFTHAETVREFAAAVEGRIMALARAHSLLSDSRWSGANLKRLVDEELAPYHLQSRERVQLYGDDLILGPAAAQSVAMVLHELATNAAKYGAFSAAPGRVTVRWSRQGNGPLTVIWQEEGGPPVAPPSRRGFGMSLIERTVADQLDGAAAFDWQPSGLVCRINVPVHDTPAAPF